MPELDTLHGIEFQIKRVAQDWQRTSHSPFHAQPIFFPRCFTIGTTKKPYSTCTVDTRPMFVDPQTLPTRPRDLAKADLRRAEGLAFRPLLGLLEGGLLLVKARGKELVLTAGRYAYRFHLGLEGIIAIIDTPSFWQLVSTDLPGKNKDGEKSESMRSFLVPPQLTTPDARSLKHDQTINVFAAFVGLKDTFIITDHSRLLHMHIMVLSRSFQADDLQPGSQLWPNLWSSNHGPDWIFEQPAAERGLDAWRDTIIGSNACTRRGLDTFLRQHNSATVIQRVKAAASRRSKAALVVGQRCLIPLTHTIMHVLTERQDIFNGYGQHTAADVLHSLRIWPGMPAEEVCKNDALYNALKTSLHTYASQFVTEKYRELCLSIPNGPAFSFNYKSDTNYINQYLTVYRKCSVRLSRDVYNTMAMEGLFDAKHTIGAPYRCSEDHLINVNHREVQVSMYKDGDVVWYSAIKAKHPPHWRSLPGPHLVKDNVLHAGMRTTIGPASFYLYKQNQYDPKAPGKPGAKKLVSNGRPGRPAHEPRIADLRRRDDRKRKLVTEAATIPDPAKRRKIASRSAPPPPSDRVTRSHRVSSTTGP